MPVFDRVLVAIDLTDNSLPPLRKALEFEEAGSELTCLHVVPEDGEEARSFRSFFDAEGAESSVLENYALPWLENWIQEVDVSLPDSVNRRARLGDPSEQILAEATGDEFDLIVIGTHGRQGMKRYWMGSVAETVIRRSECPVLTVRANVGDPRVIEDD